MSTNEDRSTPRTTVEDEPDAELFDWEAFRSNGLLWALNRHVLHPRGLALAWFYPEGETTPTGWQIIRADDGLWGFGADLDAEGQARYLEFLRYLEARP